jgi:hypothetical protein
MNRFLFVRRIRAAARVTIAVGAVCLTSGLLVSTPAAAQAPVPQAADAVSAPQATSPTLPATVPVGTPISVALRQRLRSGEAKKGEPVIFAVAADVRTPDGGRVLIPAGAPAHGVVEESRRGGKYGRPGRLQIRCEYVLLPDGTRVPLDASLGRRGGGRQLGSALTIGAGAVVATMGAWMVGFGSGRVAGGTVLIGGITTSVLLGSALRGGNVTFEEGRIFQTRVAQDVTVPGAAPAEPRTGEPAVAAPDTAGEGVEVSRP